MPWLFTYRRYRLPFRSPVRTAHGRWEDREGILVRLQDEAGAVSYGEAAPIPWFGTETADQAEDACRSLGASIDTGAIEGVAESLPCLRNALAAASAPAGGTGPAVNALAIAALLPAGREAVGAAAPKAAAGFRAFKWKIGVGDLSTEFGVLDELCAALPEGSKLRLDANGALDRRRAEKWLGRCAERPVEYVEQPAMDQDVLLGLARDYPTPIALDESIAGNGDVERWIAGGWPGWYVVKPALLGDLPGALARLEAAKAPVVFSSALETRVGAMAALRCAFRWRGEPRALGFGVWPLFADGRFDGPWAAPFIRWSDVERVNPEEAWTALG